MDKLDIDKLKNVSSNFRNMKRKVGKLGVDELVPVPVDLSKLSNLVQIDVVRNTGYNAKIQNIEDKIPDINNVDTNTTPNVRINEVKNT